MLSLSLVNSFEHTTLLEFVGLLSMYLEETIIGKTVKVVDGSDNETHEVTALHYLCIKSVRNEFKELIVVTSS